MEATATRRAGLEKFTFPDDAGKPYFVLDLANDLPNSFAGGEMNINPDQGRITIGGSWGSRCVSKFALLLRVLNSVDVVVSDRHAGITRRMPVMIC